MARSWYVLAGLFFSAVGHALGWIAVSTLSVLGQSNRDSPAATYLVMGVVLALLSLAALAFGALQLYRAAKR